jgi:hypothetical protein
MKKLVCIFLFSVASVIVYFMLIQKQDSREISQKEGMEQTGTQTKQSQNPVSPNEGNANTMAGVQRVINLTNLPDHIKLIVNEYWHEPEWPTAKKLTPSDKTILLQLYKQETNLFKKGGLTEALGLIGDDEVVEVFKRALSNEYSGRRLKGGSPEQDEEGVMVATVLGLGFLSSKSDLAFDIIKKGTAPEFWKGYCKFIPSTGPAFYGLLTSRSIKAIGFSGRPDATNFLELLKPLPLVNDLDNSIMRMSFDGAVFDAAFANDIIAQQGMDYYKFLYFNLNASLERMREWQKSGIGLEWDKWYQKRKME